MQVKAKYNATMVELFREAFCWLPLGHVLNHRVLVVHGGLFSNDQTSLDDIRSVDRYRHASSPFTLRLIVLSWRLHMHEVV